MARKRLRIRDSRLKEIVQKNTEKASRKVFLTLLKRVSRLSR